MLDALLVNRYATFKELFFAVLANFANPFGFSLRLFVALTIDIIPLYGGHCQPPVKVFRFYAGKPLGIPTKRRYHVTLPLTDLIRSR